MNKLLKTTGPILIFLVLFTLFLSFQYSTVAAEDNYTTIVVGSGNSKAGPIFKSDGIDGQGLWYPGYSASNILRVKNNLGEKIIVNKIGMTIVLERDGKALSLDHEDAKSFMSSMKIKVDYKNIIDKTFKSKIFDGDFLGFVNGANCNITIGNKKEIDLQYTVSMDKDAGNEVQGIKATVDFIINVSSESIDTEEPTEPKEPEEKAIFSEYELAELKPTDIEGHWAHDCIITLIKHGIIKGYPDGTIRPDNYVTRAETAVLVGRALGIQEDGEMVYKDSIPSWAREYVKATTTHNIFTGYPNNTFKPNRNITREEMTAVLMRAFHKTLEDDTELGFIDANKIGDWALEHIKTGVEHKVIEGYPDKTFKPKNNITRAEAFTMICKLLGYHENHEIENKR